VTTPQQHDVDVPVKIAEIEVMKMHRRLGMNSKALKVHEVLLLLPPNLMVASSSLLSRESN
jgi:hypothetical protein